MSLLGKYITTEIFRRKCNENVKNNDAKVI